MSHYFEDLWISYSLFESSLFLYTQMIKSVLDYLCLVKKCFFFFFSIQCAILPDSVVFCNKVLRFVKLWWFRNQDTIAEKNVKNAKKNIYYV